MRKKYDPIKYKTDLGGQPGPGRLHGGRGNLVLTENQWKSNLHRVEVVKIQKNKYQERYSPAGLTKYHVGRVETGKGGKRNGKKRGL